MDIVLSHFIFYSAFRASNVLSVSSIISSRYDEKELKKERMEEGKEERRRKKKARKKVLSSRLVDNVYYVPSHCPSTPNFVTENRIHRTNDL